MTAKRARKKASKPLTATEMAASDHVRECIDALRRVKTQEQIANEVGVTQGQIWQWAERKLAVPARRAVSLAAALETRPELVSAAYAALALNKVKEQPGEYALDSGQQAILAIYATLSADQRATWRAVGDALAQQADAVTKTGTSS